MVAFVILGVLLFVVTGLVAYAAMIYNGLVVVKNNILKAWANIQADDATRQKYQKARGKGGFRRVDWDEALEIMAAANIHTAKKHGPDRVIGFSPIPAMSMLSYAAGGRFLRAGMALRAHPLGPAGSPPNLPGDTPIEESPRRQHEGLRKRHDQERPLIHALSLPPLDAGAHPGHT